MSAMEFMARLAALIAPPRYPLVRYAGVFGPRSAWRRDVVPRPRERTAACDAESTPSEAGAEPGVAVDADSAGRSSPKDRTKNEANDSAIPERRASTAKHAQPTGPSPGDVALIAPNVLSVRHWDRLFGGALYADTPRVDWARLLRRSFDVDVLQCPRCQGRLRVIAVITEREPVQRILAHVGLTTDPPPLARARDPTDDVHDVEPPAQLELALA